MSEYCGGCAQFDAVRSGCIGSFARIGVTKVHWECWSNCNLHCKFCYRTEDVPLEGYASVRLLDACRTAGAKAIVFAGGDPTLRPDLCALIDYAASIGLGIEMQSNFQRFTAAVQDRIKVGRIGMCGVSLDGATEQTHDRFRSTRGNFNAVLKAVEFLETCDTPVVVRTIVTSQNWREIADIAMIVSRFPTVKRWSLLEFSPIGYGFDNRSLYEIDVETFNFATRTAIEHYSGRGEVDVYRSNNKVGTYGLITAAGNIYGVSKNTVAGRYPIVGSMLSDHLLELARLLPFSRVQHKIRYGE